MPDQESWIALERAVAIVHAAVGGPSGPVHRMMVSICGEGLVRARWTDHPSRTAAAIPRQDWNGASLDWLTGGIIKANGRRMAGVHFNEDDLKALFVARHTHAEAGKPDYHAPATLAPEIEDLTNSW